MGDIASDSPATGQESHSAIHISVQTTIHVHAEKHSPFTFQHSDSLVAVAHTWLSEIHIPLVSAGMQVHAHMLTICSGSNQEARPFQG